MAVSIREATLFVYAVVPWWWYSRRLAKGDCFDFDCGNFHFRFFVMLFRKNRCQISCRAIVPAVSQVIYQVQLWVLLFGDCLISSNTGIVGLIRSYKCLIRCHRLSKTGGGLVAGFLMDGVL